MSGYIQYPPSDQIEKLHRNAYIIRGMPDALDQLQGTLSPGKETEPLDCILIALKHYAKQNAALTDELIDLDWDGLWDGSSLMKESA